MVRLRPIAVYVGGSTLTSLRPGVSIAGPSPEGTLYTPTLDLEYLALGMPSTLNIVPVSPEGLPTPAVLTRAVLQLVDVPYLTVDAGTYYGIKAPHVKLPSARPGNDIAEQDALPPGTAAALFSEGESLGAMVARGHDLILIGESIPGGTTVAAAVMTALGFEGVGLVSSASPDNPKVIKRQIVLRALSRARTKNLRLNNEIGPIKRSFYDHYVLLREAHLNEELLDLLPVVALYLYSAILIGAAGRQLTLKLRGYLL